MKLHIKPRRIRFLTTFYCNAKCPYCHNEGQAVPVNSTMNEEFVGKLLDIVPTEEVILSGGEPTLNPHIVEIAKAVKERGIYLSITTNGTLTDRLYKLFPYLDEIKFNVDSLSKEAYEAIKQLPFEATIKNVMAAYNAGIYTKLNTPFISLANAQELLNFSESTKVEIKFIEVLELGGFSDPSLEIIKLESLLEDNGYFLEKGDLKKTWKKGNNTITTMRCLCRAAVMTGDVDDAKELCREQGSLYVTPNGEIKPCIYEEFSIPIYDSVMNGDLKSLQQKFEEFDHSFGIGLCQDIITNQKLDIEKKEQKAAIRN
ncbi:radical SAM protein [Hassallia byssoidea VB512170]|uniref:Radical SAM protein n=1 Tax=Hassallia byssoidea VB512170 TaxID=1304833 RepID=A0A846HAH5_9CYAN|nr:radical SAM protein [Hassalia byssoidea VB512170]